MLNKHSVTAFLLLGFSSFLLASCASSTARYHGEQYSQASPPPPPVDYAERLPHAIETSGQKVVLINPRVHAWGAYNSEGNLIRAGLVTAGGDWCPDINRPCRTKSGIFRIQSLGSPECKSSKYPLPRGGAPMPYCMFFNGNQGIHGSPANAVVEANVSHGCVRMHIPDAEWLRYSFAHVGTKVIVEPY